MAATLASTQIAGRVGAALALLALLAWLGIYLRVSAPINRRLRAAG